jgi:hypothetical protein
MHLISKIRTCSNTFLENCIGIMLVRVQKTTMNANDLFLIRLNFKTLKGLLLGGFFQQKSKSMFNKKHCLKSAFIDNFFALLSRIKKF